MSRDLWSARFGCVEGLCNRDSDRLGPGPAGLEATGGHPGSVGSYDGLSVGHLAGQQKTVRGQITRG